MGIFFYCNILRILIGKRLIYIMGQEDWEWLSAFKSLLIKVQFYTGVRYICIQITVLFLPSLPYYSSKIVLVMSFSETYLMKECSKVYLDTVISGLSFNGSFCFVVVVVFSM